jgi:hypothetical protein
VSTSKHLKIVTPKGTAVWPKLNEPDRKFQPEGVYTVKLRVAVDEAQDFIDALNAAHAEAYRHECVKNNKKSLKQAPMPWSTATDWDSENETRVDVDGFIDFKFSMKAKITTKTGKSWEQRPALFDSKLQPLPPDSDHIGGGSIIRISSEPYFWYSASLGFGLTLRPRAVQVIELKSYSGSAEHGFSEEDGFSVETTGSGDF